MSASAAMTLLIVLAVLSGILFRPLRWPEWVFSVGGAASLLATGLISPAEAGAAIMKGTNVYLFLTGMMMLAALAMREGLFDHLAARAAGAANGSGPRLFLILYVTDVLVTVFLSNDATAVVLTPAVVVVAQHAKVDPRPHLFACAFVANAASFVLPFSNPANLVVFGQDTPRLASWLGDLALPSIGAILITFLVLRHRFAPGLAAARPHEPEIPQLSGSGRFVAIGLALTAGILVLSSAGGVDLGWPTLACGVVILAGATLAGRRPVLPLLRNLSWGVLPLVAGLFVLVEALLRGGFLAPLTASLAWGIRDAPQVTALLTGTGFGLVSNLVNNLPAGLVAASALSGAEAPRQAVEAALIGIDLGPNLSVTGSLATLLWLIALRRERIGISSGEFLRIGVIAMPAALLASLGLLLV